MRSVSNIVTALAIGMLSTATHAAPPASVELLSPYDTYASGDVIELRGHGFAPSDAVRSVTFTAIYPNRTTHLVDIVAPDHDLAIDSFGELRGSVTIGSIPAGIAWADVSVFAAQSSVSSSPWFPVVSSAGASRPAKTAAVTTGSVTIDDNNGVAPADEANPSERIDFDATNSGGWDTDFPPLAVSFVRQYEYSDLGGTTYIKNTVLSTSNVSILQVNTSDADSVSGYVTLTSTFDATALSIKLRVRLEDDDLEIGTVYSNVMPIYVDTDGATLASAWATSLDSIYVVFNESVRVPVSNDSAKANWAITGYGAPSVSSVTPLDTWADTVKLVLGSNLNDYGAEPTVTFNTFTGSYGHYEDAADNDAATSNTTAADNIAPATVTVTAPDVNTLVGTTSFSITATVGGGTDTSLDGVIFEGSDDGSTWYGINRNHGSGVDIDGDTADNTFSVTWYPDGTDRRFTMVRARAFDDANGSANNAVDSGDNVSVSASVGSASSTNDLKSAFRVAITSSAATVYTDDGGAAANSAAITIRTEDRYGQAAAVYGQGTTTFDLTSNSSGQPKFWSDDGATTQKTSISGLHADRVFLHRHEIRQPDDHGGRGRGLLHRHLRCRRECGPGAGDHSRRHGAEDAGDLPRRHARSGLGDRQDRQSHEPDGWQQPDRGPHRLRHRYVLQRRRGRREHQHHPFVGSEFVDDRRQE